MRTLVHPSGVERYFEEDEIIVSKTDLSGRITYANEVFVKISGFSEEQLLGEQHNIIRHPDMPRCVFKLLWDTISSGREIFAYVKNMCANGDHYWVFAHVTPTFDQSGQITNYHSNRRVPEPAAVAKMEEIYRLLAAEESRHVNPKLGMEKATELLTNHLATTGMPYEEFVFSL